MEDNLTSKYSDLNFEKVDIKKFKDMPMINAMQYDYFNSYIDSNDSAIIYIIKNKLKHTGYISIYNIDYINKCADIYGNIVDRKDYSDLVRGLISLMTFVVDILKFNKLNFKFREDYIFKDICGYLSFIKEGVFRNQFIHEEKYHNIVSFGLISHEFRRLAANDYKKMYTWDYNYEPENFKQIDIKNIMNNRSFTNDIYNYNKAILNNLNNSYEFLMNKVIPNVNYLSYKNAKFTVNIFDTTFPYDSFTCDNQIINIPEKNYNNLLIIATAQYGYQKSDITLVYNDDTFDILEFNVNDWCEVIHKNEYPIYSANGCSRFNNHKNIVKCVSYIYLERIEVNYMKKLKKIIFPNNNKIFVFAIGLCKK